jgi:hypothetical protein
VTASFATRRARVVWYPVADTRKRRTARACGPCLLMPLCARVQFCAAQPKPHHHLAIVVDGCYAGGIAAIGCGACMHWGAVREGPDTRVLRPCVGARRSVVGVCTGVARGPCCVCMCACACVCACV